MARGFWKWELSWSMIALPGHRRGCSKRRAVFGAPCVLLKSSVGESECKWKPGGVELRGHRASSEWRRPPPQLAPKSGRGALRVSAGRTALLSGRDGVGNDVGTTAGHSCNYPSGIYSSYFRFWHVGRLSWAQQSPRFLVAEVVFVDLGVCCEDGQLPWPV